VLANDVDGDISPINVNLNDKKKFDDDVSYKFFYTGCQKNDKIKITVRTPAPAATETTRIIFVQ